VGPLVNGVNGYRGYAGEGEAVGLTAGGHWTKFKDWPHVQHRSASNVGSVVPFLEIDSHMRARFGG